MAASDTAVTVVAVGEVLWDASPSGIFLGGAPANVAVHLRGQGVASSIISCVGNDDLGDEVLLRLQERNVDVTHVQRSSVHPTGFVRVTFSGSEPSYTVRPGAWDHIQLTEDAKELVSSADALVFGSIAQRGAVSRAAIQALVKLARRCVFDVNFRAPFIDKETILACAAHAWLLKLNHEEAAVIAEEWLGGTKGSSPVDHARALGTHFGCHCVVTCAEDGAVLYIKDGQTLRHDGCAVVAIDAVGAGDAFLSSLLHDLLVTQQPDYARALAKADAVGAWVATQRGATPQLNIAAINALMAASPATRECA
jgi:fructokinase